MSSHPIKLQPSINKSTLYSSWTKALTEARLTKYLFLQNKTMHGPSASSANVRLQIYSKLQLHILRSSKVTQIFLFEPFYSEQLQVLRRGGATELLTAYSMQDLKEPFLTRTQRKPAMKLSPAPMVSQEYILVMFGTRKYFGTKSH